MNGQIREARKFARSLKLTNEKSGVILLNLQKGQKISRIHLIKFMRVKAGRDLETLGYKVVRKNGDHFKKRELMSIP